LPEILQKIAVSLPLVHIFEEVRSILVDGEVNYKNIFTAIKLNFLYLAAGIGLFYFSFYQARKKGTLLNIGE